MSDSIVIRVRQDLSAEWIIVGGGSQLSSPANGSLVDAAKEIDGRRVIILVPASDVLLLNVEIPVTSFAKIQSALPFALEESLAEDIEDLHFAVGSRMSDSSLEVAVVSKEKMEYWLTALKEVEIEPSVLTSESQGLSKLPGTMSMLIEGKTIVFNDGDKLEFTAKDLSPTDTLVATGQLERSDDERKNDSKHLFVFCSHDENKLFSKEWLKLQDQLNSIDINILAEGVLPKLAVTVASGNGIDLLQGSYAKKTEYNKLFKPWKTAASLFFGLIFISLTTKLITYYDMIKYEHKLRSQFISDYREIKPNDLREIVDPVATVNSLKIGMNNSGVPQLFLPSLNKLSDAVSKHTDVQINAISYRSGVINLRLIAPNITTLDKIQKEITSSGEFLASIQSTDQIADKIDSRLQIKRIGL